MKSFTARALALASVALAVVAMALSPSFGEATPQTVYSAPDATAPPGPTARAATALQVGHSAMMMELEPIADTGARSPLAAPKGYLSGDSLIARHAAAVRLMDPGDVRATVAFINTQSFKSGSTARATIGQAKFGGGA